MEDPICASAVAIRVDAVIDGVKTFVMAGVVMGRSKKSCVLPTAAKLQMEQEKGVIDITNPCFQHKTEHNDQEVHVNSHFWSGGGP